MIRILFLLAGAMIAAHAADVNGLLATARSSEKAADFAGADDAYNAALELAISKEMQHLSRTAVEVAGFYSRRQEPQKAEMVLKRALNAADAAGQPPPAEIPVLMQLQLLYQYPARSVDLAPVQTRLVKAWESEAGPDSTIVANTLYHLAGTLERNGQLTDAEQAIERAIAILEKHYGGMAPTVGFARTRETSINNQLGKTNLAPETLNGEPATGRQPAASVRMGRGVTAPRPIYRPEPKYSEKARKKKLEGTVILSLVVGANGEPEDIKIMLPLGEGLDEQAVEAVRAWRFQPGMKDGQPVRVQATIEVNFRLL